MSAGRKRTNRPTFDPGRITAPEGSGSLFSPAGKSKDDAPLTVSQLTKMVRGALQQCLPGECHVMGELSNFSRSAGGHCYFTLKDADSEVKCVMWRSSATSLRFEPEDGLAVVAVGSIDVYEPRGQYQFYVRRMEPQGVGSLEVAFRRLKERLEKEGLFDAARKRALPEMPRRIAVVTSPTGAAIRDILQTIRRRFPCVEVLVYGVRVQGEGAADEIADAIRRISRSRDELGGVDVMIVGRGGGSLEDLWAFNEEVVARAIHASRIPIVSAVGHEVDFTISDFVADVRAATPTAAAELVVPVLSEIMADVDDMASRLAHGIRRRLDTARMRLEGFERHEWFRDPIGRVRQRQQQVDEAAARLSLAVSRALEARRGALHRCEVRLVRVRPEAVLARRRELLGRVEHRLRWAQGAYNLKAERRLRQVVARMSAASPAHHIEGATILLEQLLGRLRRAVNGVAAEREQRLATLETRLAANSHTQVLARGFSITRRKRTGEILRKAAEAKTGERLVTETAEGEVISRVEDARQGELFE